MIEIVILRSTLMPHPSSCPKCGIAWLSDKTIPEDLFNSGKYESMEAAIASAKDFGWKGTERFSRNVVALYDIEADRTVRWRCRSCNASVERN